MRGTKNKKASTKLIIFIIIILVIIITIFFIALYLERKAAQPKEENTVSPITGAAVQQNQLQQNQQTQNQNTQTSPAQVSATQVYFCPREDCEQAWVDAVNKASTVECAMYDLDSQKLIQALKNKNAKLLIDTDNIKDAQAAHLNFTKDKNSYLMHDKFCILDNKTVITGSTNPTDNCFHKNNNNLIIFDSPTFAKNYQNELNALLLKSYNKQATAETKVLLNGKIYKNYFCPQDSCKEHVYAELKKAEKSIYFMTFSFTDNDLGDIIVTKHKAGVNVSGVFEKKQIDEWSEFKKLKKNGIDVIEDTNKYNMHHKVFIIDEKTVVTGSYNPSANGDEHNNENIIVIEDPEIAQKYVKEFFYVRYNSTVA